MPALRLRNPTTARRLGTCSSSYHALKPASSLAGGFMNAANSHGMALVKHGPRPMPWPGFVCRQLAAVPEQVVQLHGRDLVPERRRDELERVQRTRANLALFR